MKRIACLFAMAKSSFPARTAKSGKIRSFKTVLCLLLTVIGLQGYGQSILFSDDYERATISPGGTPSMTYTSTINGTQDVISTQTVGGSLAVQIGNGSSGSTTISWLSGLLGTFSSPFNSTLSSNSDVISWTFNMRANQGATGDFTTTTATAASKYTGAVILASSASSAANLLSTGSGYAVIMKGTNSGRQIDLVKFTGGIATTTNVVAGATTLLANATNYASVRVSYTPSTNSWQLLIRDDGSTAFADPYFGTLVSQGSAIDNTYTGTAMTYFGFMWGHPSASTKRMVVDNFKIAVGRTYYNTASADLASLSTWGDNATGTGSGANPASFSGNYQNFVIKNASPTLSVPLTISGTGSKITIGDATTAYTYTVPAANAITATIDVTNNATLNIANATSPTLGILYTGSTVGFTGSSAQTIPSATYSGLTVNNNAGATLASTAIVNSKVTLTNGILTGGSSLTLAAGATIARTAGSLAAAPTFGTTVNLLYTNTSNITAGVEVPTATNVLSGVSTLGGTAGMAVTFDANTTAIGTITINGSNLTIATGKTFTLGSTAVLTVTTGKIDVNGTLLNQASTSMVLTPTFGIYVNSNGTYVHNTTGGIATPLGKMNLDPNSNFIYRGSNSVNTLPSVSGKSYAGNLSFECVAGAWAPAISGTGSLTVGGNLSFSASGGGTFTTGTGFTGAYVVAKNISIGSSTTFAPGGAVSLGGHWTQAGTLTPGTSVVTFSGTAQQEYTNTGSGNITSLTLNNSVGLLLKNAMTLSGTLTLTSGKFDLAAFSLTLSGSTGIGASAFGTTATSYIIASNTAGGKLIIQNIGQTGKTGDVLFPVGYDASTYNPITINTGTGTNTFEVNVINAPVGGVTAAESLQKSWSVTRSSGSSAAVVKVQWVGDEGASFTRTSCQVVDYNGTSIDGSGSLQNAAISPYNVSSVVAFSSFNIIGVTNLVVYTTFNNVPGLDITLTTSWGDGPGGTGTPPADFTTQRQIFTINGAGATMSQPWTVSGTGSSIVVGDGIGTVTFSPSQAITGAVNVADKGTLQLVGATYPTLGTLSTGSTVDYSGSGQVIVATNYHHLTLSGTGTTFPSGTVGIAGTFTPGSITGATQGTVDFKGAAAQEIAAFNYFNLTSTGSRTLASSGTIGVAGTFTPGATTYTTIASSTLAFNGTGTQTVPVFNYFNLSVPATHGANTVTLASGTIGVAGSFTPASGNTYSVSGNTVSFNGSGTAQTIPAFAFNNITCANTAGTNIAAGTTASYAGTATTALNISSGILTVNGTLDCKSAAATTSGNATSTAGTLVFSSTGAFRDSAIAASLSSTIWIPTATWADSSNCILAMSFSGTAGDFTGLYNVAQTFSNFTIDIPGLNGKLVVTEKVATTPATPFSVTGTMYVLNTGTSTGVQLLKSNTNSNTLNIGKYVQRSGNTFIASNTTTSATRVVNVARDFVLENASLFNVIASTGGTAANNATLNLSGDLTIGSAATFTRTQSGTTTPVGTLAFVGSAPLQTLSIAAGGTFSGPNNVTISKTAGNVTFANDLTIGATLTLSGTNTANLTLAGNTTTSALTLASGNTGNVTMGGNLTVSNALALTAGNIVAGANNLTLGGAVTRTAGTVDATSGTVTFAGTSATQSIPSGLFSALNNLTINNTHTTPTVTMLGNVAPTGTLTLTAGSLVTNGNTLSIGGNTTRSAGTINATSGALVYNGSVTVQNIAAGTFSGTIQNLEVANSAGVTSSTSVSISNILTLTNGTFNIGGNTLTLAGSIVAGSGRTDATLGTVAFTGSVAQSIPANAFTSATFGALTISNAAGVTLNENTQVSGNATLTSGALAIGTNTISLAGNVTRGTGSISAATGSIVFNGASAQAIDAGFTSVNNITVNNSGGATVTITGATTVNLLLALTQGSLAMSGGTLSMAASSDIIRTAGALLSAPNFVSQVDVRYQNSSALPAITAGFELPANDADIQSVSVEGTGSVILSRPVDISANAVGQLLLSNSGKLQLGDFNLTVKSINHTSATAWVITNGEGGLKMRNVPMGVDQIFPVGLEATYYTPVTINPTALTDWKVVVRQGIQPASAYTGAALQRTWDITPTNPTPGATAVRFQFPNNTALYGPTFVPVDGQPVSVYHYNVAAVPAAWEQVSSPTATLVSGWFQVDASLTDFSPYGIAQQNTPLPVQLLSFTGKRVNNVNELKWVTATESNNRGFQVERSIDGRTFTQVGFVASQASLGNSTSELAYRYLDAGTSGTRWYYRLRQVDMDGRFKYSGVISISTEKSNVLTVDGVYPNPAKATIQVRLQAGVNSGNTILQLSDMAGRIVKVKTLSLEAGASTTATIDIRELAAGVYHLKAVSSSGEVSETVSVVKQ